VGFSAVQVGILAVAAGWVPLTVAAGWVPWVGNLSRQIVSLRQVISLSGVLPPPSPHHHFPWLRPSSSSSLHLGPSFLHFIFYFLRLINILNNNYV
jgi:hypothetical protein